MDASIITVDQDTSCILNRKTEDIKLSELALAKKIGRQLIATLKNNPSAGLAAPQIGYSRSVFVYSYDRDPSHLQVVINPSWEPIENNRIEGWEACFSGMSKDNKQRVAKLSRYAKIKVSYLTLEGEVVEKILEGFAAKVFQHEVDHLQGIVNIQRKDAIVKVFDSEEDFLIFMENVKHQDAKSYKSHS